MMRPGDGPRVGQFIPRGSGEPQRPAVVVHSWNPLRRDIRRHETVATGTRIRDLAPITPLPFVCIRNGEPLLRRDWDLRVVPGDIIAFQVLPQGGGGDGGSNPLQVILGIVLVVIGVVVTVLSDGALAFIGEPLIVAGIGLIAGGVLAALAPSPKAHLAGAAGGFDSESASPSYSVSLRGNAARLNNPVPVVYGRMQLFPDYAAPPYYIYRNNDQYLVALFCIGHGYFDLEAIRLDDTPLSSLDGVNYQVFEPGQVLGSTVVAGVTPGPGKSLIVITARVNVLTAPEVAGQNMDEGAYIGPFIICPNDHQVDQILIDIIWPRGLYLANTSNGNLGNISTTWVVEAQAIDEYDQPAGAPEAWTVLATETYEAASSTPQRKTYAYNVTAGRYRVRVKRTDTRNPNSNAAHDMVWGALRGGLVAPPPAVQNLTYLALVVKASNQLSQLSQRKFNVICTRKIPSWSPGGGWSARAPSRSIAWALADVLKDPVYGAGLADSRIDLARLHELDSVWTSRGDLLNAVFDSRITLWEALTQIARAGRAAVILQAGLVTVVRDQAQTLPTALFSMRNIKRGSFSVQYSVPNEDAPDAITLEYFDEKVWLPRQVTELVPGGSGLKPAKLQIFGVTSKLQAQREARFLAFNNYHRRRIIRFEVEMDGFLASYGDLVAIAHDLPAWGASGDVSAYNAGTLTMTLTEPVSFDPQAATHYVIFSAASGQVCGPYACVAGANASELVLQETPALTPATGADKERSRFSFGAGQSWGQLGRVISIRPRTMESVEIICIAEADPVHTADSDLFVSAARQALLLAPDNINAYDYASEAQLASYGWLADNGNFLGSRNEPAYLFRTE